jgi:hypothetical protein
LRYTIRALSNGFPAHCQKRRPRSKRLSRRSAIAASESKSGSDARPVSLAGAGLPAPGPLAVRRTFGARVADRVQYVLDLCGREAAYMTRPREGEPEIPISGGRACCSLRPRWRRRGPGCACRSRRYRSVLADRRCPSCPTCRQARGCRSRRGARRSAPRRRAMWPPAAADACGRAASPCR